MDTNWRDQLKHAVEFKCGACSKIEVLTKYYGDNFNIYELIPFGWILAKFTQWNGTYGERYPVNCLIVCEDCYAIKGIKEFREEEAKTKA